MGYLSPSLQKLLAEVAESDRQKASQRFWRSIPLLWIVVIGGTVAIGSCFVFGR